MSTIQPASWSSLQQRLDAAIAEAESLSMEFPGVDLSGLQSKLEVCRDLAGRKPKPDYDMMTVAVVNFATAVAAAADALRSNAPTPAPATPKPAAAPAAKASATADPAAVPTPTPAGKRVKDGSKPNPTPTTPAPSATPAPAASSTPAPPAPATPSPASASDDTPAWAAALSETIVAGLANTDQRLDDHNDKLEKLDVRVTRLEGFHSSQPPAPAVATPTSDDEPSLADDLVDMGGHRPARRISIDPRCWSGFAWFGAIIGVLVGLWIDFAAVTDWWPDKPIVLRWIFWILVPTFFFFLGGIVGSIFDHDEPDDDTRRRRR